MKSAVVKRSIVIAGHKTSVSLEDAFWNGLKDIGRGQRKTLSCLVADIDVQRPHTNLSSAIRIFVLDHFRSQLPRTFTDRIEADMEIPRITHAERRPQQTNGQIGDRHER